MSLNPPTASADAAAAPGTRSGGTRAARFAARLGKGPAKWFTRGLLGLVFTVWSLLLIAWLTLHWGILPHIQQWREPLEQRASRALGVPVRIGSIEVRSGGWVPSFELHDVVLLDAAQRPALRLPRVFAAISPRSILSWQVRFEQLLIDGAQLEVRRDATGRIFVAGLDMGGSGGADDGAGTDWFFAQHEFVIRGGSVRWTDEQRGAPPLALDDVRLVVRNGLRSHDIRVDATPPPEWGRRFGLAGRFTQPLLARRGDWRRWNGSAYADLPLADVRTLRRHLDLPFELSQGVGALRGWFDVRNGEPVGATVDVALRAVAMRLAADVEPLEVRALEGRFSAQRNAAGLSVAAHGLAFATGDDLRWPRGDLVFDLRQRDGQPPTGGAFTADRLDLGLMAEVAASVPLAPNLRKLLVGLAPKGRLVGLQANWSGPVEEPTRYRARGRFEDLALAPGPAPDPHALGRPGLHGANLQFDASETGGTARLAMHGGGLELPGVFEDPTVPFDQLGAQLQWTLGHANAAQPGSISVQVRQAAFSNADASGELSALWRSGPGTGAGRAARFPGSLELDARLGGVNAGRVARYLPTSLPKGTRDYLQRAIRGGQIPSAGFHVKGELADFPFFPHGSPSSASAPHGAAAEAGGEFRVDARIEDGTFAFVPGTPTAPSRWPVLARARADLLLEHGVLQLRNASTQLGGIDFPRVQVAIDRLDSDPVLTLTSAAHGPLATMLQAVNGSPVSDWIGHALASTTATGAADLKLDLSIPLAHAEAATVDGNVQLSGNDLRPTPDAPLLGGTRGRVDFTNKGFTLVGASARLYGGQASVEGGTDAKGNVHFEGQGSASAEGLRHATELGPLARAAVALSGQTSYKASLGFVRGQPELDITSNLVGLGIDLPAPLGKAAEAPRALHVATRIEPTTGTGESTPPLRDMMQVELGDQLKVHYLRDLSGPTPRVLSGGIGVFDAAPQPASGVAANVVLARLATDEWQAAATRLFGGEPERTGGTGKTGDTGDTGDSRAPSGYEPDTIALRVQDLVAGQRHLTRLSAGLSQLNGTWRANLDADQLAGYVEYRLPRLRANDTMTGGRVFARLSRLAIPKDQDAQVESLLDQQPATLPALDVVVDDVDLHGRKLGRVEIVALNRSTAQGRDWQLSKFDITVPEATLSATGHWSAVNAVPGVPTPRRAVMDFKLQIADSGALLARFGTPGAIRGGKGQLVGQIGWLGSPFALDYPSLAGQINVAVDSGQFLKVDPGAARLLGVLSLQSLPRRLSLDFRDLFQQGFAFDSITGDVNIASGVAKTNNLRMRGVQALVLMEGSADLGHETQDLRAVVVPEINAGTAALAYAVINPALGLGAFLAQAILKKPLTEAGTREFRITGPWDDPKVDRVAHKTGDDPHDDGK